MTFSNRPCICRTHWRPTALIIYSMFFESRINEPVCQFMIRDFLSEIGCFGTVAKTLTPSSVAAIKINIIFYQNTIFIQKHHISYSWYIPVKISKEYTIKPFEIFVCFRRRVNFYRFISICAWSIWCISKIIANRFVSNCKAKHPSPIGSFSKIPKSNIHSFLLFTTIQEVTHSRRVWPEIQWTH